MTDGSYGASVYLSAMQEWEPTYMEVSSQLAAVAFCQLASRHDDQDQRDCSHEEAESNIAGGLNARFAGGKAPRIDVVHRPVAEDQGQVAQRIKDRVCHGSEERQRSGSYGAVELQPCE